MEPCTYRVTRMQGSWTVSFYRNIHTQTHSFGSLSTGTALHSFMLLVLFFLFPPSPSVCGERDGSMREPSRVLPL
ncbi:hypothetical protein PGIGA_G00023250 [Pangasianodon gigas]|uniref:Uncharacterized protein n=1 Tax=Pangasianodon gigas TaxID=30993 RepID=A0ACC5WVX6_PANGG|nr:hypothetical protein [Pangasianodon gigas]